jgi:hypothetical protein
MEVHPWRWRWTKSGDEPRLAMILRTARRLHEHKANVKAVAKSLESPGEKRGSAGYWVRG